ncbi:MAG: MATE family efflux transporter [Eubacterium ramulus]
MERNLTTGSVLKNILYFSLPYLLSYFLQTLYGMADLFIVGQFDGVASTTAVSVGSQVMHMITVMLVGLAMGTTVTIGQAVGAGNREKASKNSWKYRSIIYGAFCCADGSIAVFR